MIIDCISDLHGHYPKLEGGDLLIIAGDCTATDSVKDWVGFYAWLKIQPYKCKVYIGGNHDNLLQKGVSQSDPNHKWLRAIDPEDPHSGIYLCDSGCEFNCHLDGFPEEDEGFLPSGKRTLKIWGSPWTKSFPGMNPKCKAFTVDTEEELAEKWELIPKDTNILITHSPPFGIMDQVKDYSSGKIINCGSESLHAHRDWDAGLILHVFGHIHEGYGIEKETSPIFKAIDVNASHVNEHYKPVNKPIRVIL